MNMRSNINKEDIKAKFNYLINSKTEEELIERDSLILQANYLSEIERLSKTEGFNRKDLAIKINTSPSYLTQVFKGDKPLNFLTLAKIKRALNLRFEVKATINKTEKENFEMVASVQATKIVYSDTALILSKSLTIFDPIKSGDFNKNSSWEYKISA